MTDFHALLRTLRDQGVEFILVGGAAAIAHGSARLTQDVDIVYRRTPDNLERLIAALQPHHPYLRNVPPRLPFLWDALTLRAGLNFTLVTDLGDIDLLGEITGGGGYENLQPYTMTMRPFDIPCLCLTIGKLIEVKRAAGRVKDFEAIAELQVIEEERGAE